MVSGSWAGTSPSEPSPSAVPHCGHSECFLKSILDPPMAHGPSWQKLSPQAAASAQGLALPAASVTPSLALSPSHEILMQGRQDPFRLASPPARPSLPTSPTSLVHLLPVLQVHPWCISSRSFSGTSPHGSLSDWPPGACASFPLSWNTSVILSLTAS